MTTPTKIVQGFSISHAAILNGATGAEEATGDFYAIREGSLEPDMDSYDNTGDDAVLSTWFWFNYCNVTISGGYVPFDLISLLTGDSITTSGSAESSYYTMPLWSMGSLNTVTRPLLIRVPSKDSDGNLRAIDFVLYKVQFEPITFDGPTYKDGLIVNYTGRALVSDKDEKGVSLTGNNRAIGKIVSRPTA